MTDTATPVRIGIIASGRGSNMVALLDACADGRIPAQVAVVLSDHGDAGALASATARGVAAIHVAPADFPSRAEHDRAMVAQLQSHGVDWVCLAGYMRRVTEDFIAPYAGRILNIHPSLLPAFPGLHAHQQALDYGVTLSGCTVHLVELAVDAGPIIAQAAVPVREGDDAHTLAARILPEEHRIYVAAVAACVRGEVQVVGRTVRRMGPVPAGG